MFEIFLFVNPIGVHCYNTEVALKEALSELNIDICFHFIPINSAEIIKGDLIRRKKMGQKINDIPQFTMVSYQALRAFHAIRFTYGQKKARTYLFNLQKAISADFNDYSENLPQEIAEKLNMNFAKIRDAKVSHYIDDSIKRDQDLAEKLNVHNIPTTIIYNQSGNYNGILLEGIVAHDKLIDIFKNSANQPQPKQTKYFASSHLRLI
ncbi:DsbA family protein [Lactobacillus sp. ESL0681]|uniref:DsbA family protein n=1 Tax=Lactobacillus sp. ESL0681 TaxID=2983211 RepID=UPI0023F95CB0|nr:DsbA family protein [Lactobacillus sp. ESL0681]WEV40410.1 DsbA family protein [Lactobacillus sp. ESL0681]